MSNLWKDVDNGNGANTADSTKAGALGGPGAHQACLVPGGGKGGSCRVACSLPQPALGCPVQVPVKRLISFFGLKKKKILNHALPLCLTEAEEKAVQKKGKKCSTGKEVEVPFAARFLL